MAETIIGLTARFEDIPVGTVFIEAARHPDVVDDPPVGLNWREAYDQIVEPTFHQSRFGRQRVLPAIGYAEKIKYRDWGYYINAKGSMNCAPDMVVIIGPPLADFAPAGGALEPDDLTIIRYLEQHPFQRAERDELAALLPRPAAFGASRIGDSLKRLQRAALVDLIDKKAYLTNLGVIRCLQDGPLD